MIVWSWLSIVFDGVMLTWVRLGCMLHGIALADFIAYFGLDCGSRCDTVLLVLLVATVISDICYTHSIYVFFLLRFVISRYCIWWLRASG